MNFLGLFIYSSLYALLNVIGASFVKAEIGTGKHVFNGVSGYFRFFLTWKTILGLFLVFLGALVLFRALSLFEFSRVIPMSIGINFILTAIIAHFFFDEGIPLMKIVGMFLILSGTVILGLAKS